MKLTYKELEIELELAGLLAVEELVLTQGLNCHAGLTLKILIEEEQRDELVTMSSDAGVTVRELEKTNGQVVFRGKLETVSARRENGLFYLYLEAWSYTMDWDRVKKSRSFQNGALTYMEVLPPYDERLCSTNFIIPRSPDFVKWFSAIFRRGAMFFARFYFGYQRSHHVVSLSYVRIRVCATCCLLCRKFIACFSIK